jgi:hypothetical protein
MTTSLGGATAAEDVLREAIEANNVEMGENKEAIASTATSVE